MFMLLLCMRWYLYMFCSSSITAATHKNNKIFYGLRVAGWTIAKQRAEKPNLSADYYYNGNCLPPYWCVHYSQPKLNAFGKKN